VWALRIFSLVLARNEADPSRYFRKVLRRCREFSDAVLVLDDGSQDHTPELARKYGAEVRRRKAATPMWGNEAGAREELWRYGCEYATGRDDWLFVVDADHLIVGDPRELCQSRETNTWSWYLLDLWSETTYRDDPPFWVAHRHARPWLFAPNRVPGGWVPDFGTRGIHVGHCPANWLQICPAIAPLDVYSIWHYSYSRPEHRRAKAAQYLSKSHLLSPFETAHVQSILDYDREP
jgi:glycosyltransferase involved in cell wall biosynthesis